MKTKFKVGDVLKFRDTGILDRITAYRNGVYYAETIKTPDNSGIGYTFSKAEDSPYWDNYKPLSKLEKALR